MGDYQRFLKNLRQWLRLTGKSSKTIAAETSLSLSSLSRFFNGKSGLKTEDFVRLLDCLGVCLTDILQEKISTNLKMRHSYAKDLAMLMAELAPLQQKTLLEQVLSDPQVQQLQNHSQFEQAFLRLNRFSIHLGLRKPISNKNKSQEDPCW